MNHASQFQIQTIVERTHGPYDSVRWKVTCEINGFVGTSDHYIIGSAFEAAYNDVMAKVAEGTSEGRKS